ncbi:MAG: ATP-dependent DNA helicase, partial [Candidatus Obscuribacterales bacterium]|nr:ATP-dependent DNA helicase [Steroidobacteraceae bacterium]
AKRATCVVVGESRYWAAAECLPMVRAAYKNIETNPHIETPVQYTEREWDAQSALLDITRGRLQAIGPTTATQLSATLQQPRTAIDTALLALEVEGFVMRGQFTINDSELEWCERRLLARIHRYTLQSLRAEIEPVSAADCMRFLLEWQGVTRQPQGEGLQSLLTIVEQLEGCEVPAAAWETDVLPSRLHDYDPNWLDSACLSGRALWARLTPPKASTGGPIRSTPISLVTRKHSALWQSLASQQAATLQLSHPAQAIAQHLQTHGASFFDDIKTTTQLLPSQAEDGLAELVAAGLVTADSFSGLRALLIPQERKRRMAARGRRIALFGLEDAGRWSLVHRHTSELDATALEQIAWILLRRYGVVFRRVLEREADWLPPWHVLLRALRRLEAQGHIRGGRFVAGIPGEQFALPDAVAALRALRRKPASEQLVSLSAADPLNLVGTLLPGARVPALTGNRILLRDGVPIAVYIGGEAQFLTALEPEREWAARNVLLHKQLMHAQTGAT